MKRGGMNIKYKTCFEKGGGRIFVARREKVSTRI
jgi:hypothetical protein